MTLISATVITQAVESRVKELQHGQGLQRVQLIQDYLHSSGFVGDMLTENGLELENPGGLDIIITIHYLADCREVKVSFFENGRCDWITEKIVDVSSERLLSEVVNTVVGLIQQAQLAD